MKGWHFVSDTFRDGSGVPADGVTLTHDGPLVICETGLHASERILDALRYAPGNTICRVEAEGCEAQGHDDKFVCRSRTILWRVDGELILREFARHCALDVIHLWDAPAVARKYLETGDENKRDAAKAAARDAAEAAGRDAARAAGRIAARTAAWAAARAAAWAVARAAAGDAAKDVAWDAARNAAWAVARAAAKDAAGAAAGDAQNKRLTEMVMAAHGARALLSKLDKREGDGR